MELRTISKEELTDILDKHGAWLQGEARGARANLSFANLSSADLRYANLTVANLSFADLRYANLTVANLSFANLSSADLRYANLRYANLSFADLLIFQFQRHVAYFTLDGSLRIGCHVLPILAWIETYQQVGKSEGYSEEQIAAYGGFIKICAEIHKSRNK